MKISGVVLSELLVQESSGEYVAFSGHGQNLHDTIVGTVQYSSITLPYHNYPFENLPVLLLKKRSYTRLRIEYTH